MRNLLAIRIFILLIVFTGLLNAQELSAEELLKWFPIGDYLMVTHRDDSRLAKGDSYEFYLKHFESTGKKANDAKLKGLKVYFIGTGMGMRAAEILPKNSLSLPAALKEGLFAATLATVSIAEDSVKNATNPSGKLWLSDLLAERRDIAVYRYENIALTLDAALKKNELVKTGAGLGGKPVYSFNAGTRGSRQFAWASETGELLVAPDRKMLRKMYLSGHGRSLSMMDEPAYVDLINLAPEFGAKWRMMVVRDPYQNFEDGRVGDEDVLRLYGDKELPPMTEPNADSPIMLINSLHVGEKLITRTYTIYPGSESAEKAVSAASVWSKGSGNFGPDFATVATYERTMRERSNTELRDNIVIHSLEIDEKLLEAKKNAIPAMRRGLPPSAFAVGAKVPKQNKK